MSPAEDDLQQRASSGTPEAFEPDEAPDAPSAEEAEESALPELAVIGAAAEQAGEGEGDDASEGKSPSARERLSSRTREARPRKKHGGLIAAIILLVLVIGALGAAAGWLAYLRWYAHDDALDFEGTWYVAGTETPIEISANSIQLTESVAYTYKLNTQDKTITLTLGNMTGYGSYRFSLDRSELVIFDGRADANAVLEADARWLIQAVYDDFMEKPNDVTAGIRRNRTLLTREPNAVTASSTAPASSEDASSASEHSDTPQTVWSADDWLNAGSEGAGASGADGTSDFGDEGTTNTASNANDVGSLLQGINDLPVNDAGAPDGAAS